MQEPDALEGEAGERPIPVMEKGEKLFQLDHRVRKGDLFGAPGPGFPKENLFSSACMSEFFVGMVVLAVKAGLPWKNHVARISQGLGVYSIIDVLIEAGHSYFGVSRNTQTYATLSHIRIAAYLSCVVYWIIMLWRKAPDSKRLPDHMRGQLIQLQNMVDSDLEKIRARKR
jgi:hypothetical protein